MGYLSYPCTVLCIHDFIGAMRMAPTAAMEVLLGLPALHVMIKAKTLAGICS
jgi:hypothetical protein